MRTFRPLHILIFTILGIFILSGCKKETTNSRTPISAADQKITQQIQSFKQKIFSKFKDGEEMKVDSAIWYLEAALNLTYARANNTRDIIHLDSAIVSVPLTQDSKILLSDIAMAYTNLVDSLSLHYHAISGEKGVIFTDLAAIGLTDNNVVIKMTDMITTNSNTGFSGFGPDDYWIWGYRAGRCDGTMKPWDASSKLTQHANMGDCILPISCYTSVEQTQYIYPWNVETPENPFGYWSSLLFGASGLYPEVNQCLSPAAMNYYLDGLKTIANMYKPSGKQTIKYLCHWDIAVPSEGWEHLHYAQITYGVPIAVSDPPGGL